MLLLITLALACVVGTTAQNGKDQFAIPRPFRRCFANEEFTSCASQCEPTCRNPKPGVCSLQCIAGCQCKPGFLRNGNRACVDNCQDDVAKPACAANEEFKDCGSGCEPTCRDPKPKVCTLDCVAGCQCKAGFFRNDRNECVAVCDSASSNICPENEDFKQCGTACEPSCENPRPLFCTMQCIVNVCQCKTGFFRDSNNKCVSTCGSDSCGANEEVKVCGTACEPTCSNPIPRCTKQCIANACQCMDGFIRDANNKCIPKEQCPKNNTCGMNEEVKVCGTACEPTCDNPTPKCTKQCVNNVCQCLDGFIRDSSNQCIPKESCPQVSSTTPPPEMCGPHETWTQCSRCEPSCTNMNPACDFKCGAPRCECDEGFFRSSRGPCITMEECRRERRR